MGFDPARHMDVSAEVADALRHGKPVVALESTIITHGMPYPENVKTAISVEAVIRKEGAIPATIAVVNGRIRIGLSKDEVEALGQAEDVVKLSRDNLAAAIVKKQTGSTTVAATMICAHLAGIQVFATGGIGGVHRGAQTSFDISADLGELARTPVTVVSAGAKAILDLPATLEVLETNGVPVIGYGVREFPAFWSRSSGLPVQIKLDKPEQVAEFQRTRRALGLKEGVLIGNPIPKRYEIPRETMEGFINQALQGASREGISGKAVTPYLLKRIYELSDGRSLTANVALIQNNARVAAQIAVALSELVPAPFPTRRQTQKKTRGSEP